MLVPVEVCGNTYPFRHILSSKFGLKWRRADSCFSSRMEATSPTLRRLAEYCNEFRLTLRVNGVATSGARGKAGNGSSERTSDDFDLFILDLENEGGDENIPGKIGGLPPAPGPEKELTLVHKNIAVCPADVPNFDVKPWFEEILE